MRPVYLVGKEKSANSKFIRRTETRLQHEKKLRRNAGFDLIAQS